MTFTQAELAVLLSQLRGAQPVALRAATQDARFSRKELDAAQAELIRFGLLKPGKWGRMSLDDGVERLLQTAFAPQRVLILRAEPLALPARQIIYSLRDDNWIYNTLDEQGRHVFSPLSGPDELVQDIMKATHMAPPSGQVIPPEVLPLAVLLSQATGAYLLLRGPDTQASPATALSWLTTGDGFWLVDPAGPRETARRIAIAELRERLLASVKG